MRFIKQITDFDLGETPIENLFINDYMPTANGTYVKVYLLGYKYAQDDDSSLSVNNQTIAKHLGIPLSDVLDAWDFWEKTGIIRKHHSEEEDKSLFTVEFLSLKQLYIHNNFKSIQIRNDDEDAEKSSYTSSPGDLIEANKVPEIRDMFYQINQLVRRSLVPNEMMKILEWIYNYNMDPDLIVQAFMYCIQQKKIKNIKYVGAVIRNWYDNGVTTAEKLEDHLSKTDGRYVQYDKIFKALGFNFREPSEAEKKTMDTWLDDWAFNMEVILKACENSKKTSNPNINYINSILAAWKTGNVKSIEDIPEQRPVEKSLSKKPAKQANNRFHNFEQPSFQYTNEELEELLRKKK